MVKQRVFLSASSNRALDERRLGLKRAILEKVCKAGLEPQEFWESGIPENLAWSFDNVDQVMRRCIGAIVLGFPRWIVGEPSSETRLIGEYNHYEGAVALTHGLPVFLLCERGVEDRGVIWTGGGKTITYFPESADESWVEGKEFEQRFSAWQRELAARKDIFLGYCSRSSGTAAKIQLRLERLGASILNYEMDFRGGVSILSEIENARRCCSCGVFLFSEDDPLEGEDQAAAPRDNVVFETGFFMSSKGADRCLIIREGQTKMPADLGGNIYLHLNKGGDVSAIEGRLRSFVENNL